MEVTHVLETITTSPKPSLSVASETRCSRGNAIRLEYTTGTLSALRSVDLMVTTPILKPITNIQERNANLNCQVRSDPNLILSHRRRGRHGNVARLNKWSANMHVVKETTLQVETGYGT